MKLRNELAYARLELEQAVRLKIGVRTFNNMEYARHTVHVLRTGPK